MDGFQLEKVMEKYPNINNIVILQEELQGNWIQPKEFTEEGLLQASKIEP